jgi:hypothetical protein
MNKVIDRLKIEAASLGANGILLQGTGSETTGGVVTGSGSAVNIGGTTVATGSGVFVRAVIKTGSALAIYVTTASDQAAKAQETATKAENLARIDRLDTMVHPGMTRKEMFAVVGPPTSTSFEEMRTGELKETASYVSASGKRFVITLLKNVVSQVAVN